MPVLELLEDRIVPADLTWNGPTATWVMNPVANPVITTPANQTSAEGTAISLAVAASDPGGYTLTYAAVNLPTGLSINASSGLISGTIAYSAAEDFGGSYSPTIIVADGQGGSAEATFNWTITDTPRAPILTSPGNQSNHAGQAVTLPVAASDPDGNPLTFSESGLPSGLSIDPNSGIISGTIDPSAGTAAPYAVTVTVTVDDGYLSASQTFNWTVDNLAGAPAMTNPGTQTNAAGDAVSLSVAASDASGNPLTYTAAGLPPGLTIDPSSGTISGTISNSAASSTPYTATVVASDGSQQASQSFSWNVGNVAITNPGDQSNVNGDVVSLAITAADAAGASLGYSASGLPPGLGINASTGVISGTISNAADAGSPYSATVTASDGPYSESTTFNWTVANLSLANPGNQTSSEGASVTLQLTGHDSDGDSVSYSATGLPLGLSLNSSSGLISGTIGLSAHGSSPYQVTLTVSDGTHSTSQSIVWTVTPRVALANPGAQGNAAGDSVTVALSASALAGGTLSYSATGLPSGLGINATTGVISGTIASGAASGSPYSVTVTASDGTTSSSQTFAWTVANLYLAPPATQTSADGAAISLSLAANYHGSGTLTYSATGLPPGLGINASTGLVTGTIASNADASGPYTVTVSATDGTYSASQAFTWAVNAVVTLTNPGNQTSLAGTWVALFLSATDTPAGHITYSVNGLPAGFSVEGDTGEITGTFPSTPPTSPYSVTATAADGVGTSSQTFTWNVVPLTLANPGQVSSVDGQAVTLSLGANDAANLPLTYSATGLPPGLTMNPSTGVISGTLAPNADSATGYDVAATVSDGTNTVVQNFTWTVNKIGLTVPPNLVNTEGDTINQAIPGSTITGALTFSATNLPAGLAINSASGLITGTIAPGAAALSPYTVTVDVTNGTNSASQQVTWNVNPVVTITAIADQTNNEGDAVSLPVSATDSKGATLTYSATGLPAGVSINSSTGVISGTVAAGDAAAGPSYSASVTASDGSYSTTVPVNWQIANPQDPAPTLANPGNQSNQAGDNVDLFLSATDSNGHPLGFSASNLPDGLSINSSTGEISGTIADDAVASAPYPVTVTASDGLGGATMQTFNWVVGGASVTMTAGSPITAVEGNDTGTLTLATITTADLNAGAGDFTVTVKWGDGTSDQATVTGSNGSFSVTDDHVYAERGTYTVSVAVTQDTGVGATASLAATVADGSLTLSAGFTLGAIANQLATLNVAMLSDANPNSASSDFAVTIDWGDGGGSGAVPIGSAVNGAYPISGSHTYAADGNYTVTIKVTDADGATASATTTVVVGNLYAGIPSTLSVASFSDSNPNATATNFSASVAWGDGNTTPGVVVQSGNVFTISATHSYAQSSLTQAGGVYSVTVAVNDTDGNTLQYVTSVPVVQPPLSLFVANLMAPAGIALSGIQAAVFTDPSPNDGVSHFNAGINWGDTTSSTGSVQPLGAGMFAVTAAHTFATTVLTHLLVTLLEGATTPQLPAAQGSGGLAQPAGQINVSITGASGTGTPTGGTTSVPFVIASLQPEKRVVNWSASIPANKNQNDQAQLFYVRGNAKPQPITWPQGAAAPVFPASGKLNYAFQLYDGNQAAPTLVNGPNKTTMKIAGVQQGDRIIIRDKRTGTEAALAVVMDFTWNVLNRIGGIQTLTFTAPFNKVPKSLQQNMIQTIQYALDPGANSAQNQKRLALAAQLAKTYPGKKYCQIQMPSAYGVGPMPYDFNHGHLASEKPLPDPFVRQVIDFFQSAQVTAKALAIKDFPVKQQTGIDSPNDRATYLKFQSQVQAGFAQLVAAAWALQKPFVVYHTLEYERYENTIADNDPIRNIRTDLDGAPTLYNYLPANNFDRAPNTNTFNIANVDFLVTKSNHIVLFPLRGGDINNVLKPPTTMNQVFPVLFPGDTRAWPGHTPASEAAFLIQDAL